MDVGPSKQWSRMVVLFPCVNVASLSTMLLLRDPRRDAIEYRCSVLPEPITAGQVSSIWLDKTVVLEAFSERIPDLWKSLSVSVFQELGWWSRSPKQSIVVRDPAA